MLCYRRFCVYFVILPSIFFLPSFSFSKVDLSKIPIPFINPAGDLAVYRDINHSPDQSRELELPALDGKVVRVKIRGEYWYMRMTAGNNAAEMKQTLLPYLKSINATIQQENEDKVIFSVENGEAEIWWGIADLRSYLDLNVGKGPHFQTGQGGQSR